MFSNVLGNESSIYLQMHAKNPVAWQTWGKTAFELAKKLNRPIFLSSGYSSCHWCKVMEEESFEDTSIATILNANFIPIKLDKDEYPDIDKEYQFYLQSTGEAGGWPLSIFLDTDLKPFYAGTYYSSKSMPNSPSFKEVLEKIISIYTTRYSEVKNVTATRDEFMQVFYNISGLPKPSDDKAYAFYISEFKKIFDNEFGGFRNSAKFPYSPALLFLVNNVADKEILQFLKLTADNICSKGLYDHIHAGFFRYTVDRNWLTPHFEKMLSDNAMIPRFLFKMFEVTDNKLYQYIARNTVDFVLHNMMSDYGLLNSIDADSINNKELLSEGYFYKVTDRDFSILSEAELKILPNEITITDSIVSIKSAEYIKVVALNIIFEKIAKRIEATRQAPRLDNKMITSNNFLFCTTLLIAFQSTGDEFYLEQSKLLFDKIRYLTVDENIVYHGTYGTKVITNQTLEDYVYYLECVLTFFDVTKERDFLILATNIIGEINKLFLADDGLLSINLAKNIKDTFDDDKPNPIGLYYSLSNSYGTIVDFKITDNMREFASDRLARFPTGHATMMTKLPTN